MALTTMLFAQEKIRVGVLNGPSCIPAAYMMENDNTVAGAELKFEKFADPQALLPKMIKKEIDIGFMPVNVAAKVFNSSNKAIICCAITGNGNLSVITTNKKIKKIDDSKNRTVYVAGAGATPEYMFKYILNKNNINIEKEITLDYTIPTAQIAANLISKKIEIAVVPEPFSTIAQIKSKDVFVAVDLQQEYQDFEGENNIYPLTVMVVRKEYADNNTELLDAFLSEYKKSVEWTIENPVTAGKYTEKNELGLAAGVVTKAIPKSNYTFVIANEGQKSIEKLLNIFISFAPDSIGGKLPEQDFYYGKKNP